MPNSVRTPRRLGAVAALACAGALVTAAAVAPTESASESAATRPEGRAEAGDPTPSRTTDMSDTDTSTTVASPPLSEQFLIAASVDEIETAPEPVEAADAQEVEPASTPEPEPARSVWDRVADCESGEWTGDGGFVTASANWSATAGLFEGGLQFHPDTWDGYRDADMPGAAYEATRAEQIAVAERVLAEQGWEAWPVCSRKLGLR